MTSQYQENDTAPSATASHPPALLKPLSGHPLSVHMPMPPVPTPLATSASAAVASAAPTGTRPSPPSQPKVAAPSTSASPASAVSMSHAPHWNPAVQSFLAALVANSPAGAASPTVSSASTTPMLPNAQPSAAQMATSAGPAGFPPQIPPPGGAPPFVMPSAAAAPPASAFPGAAPPFFPPNLPYAGLATMGYPTQSTLAASALLSGLPLPGALPAAAAVPQPVLPPGMPLAGQTPTPGALPLPAGFNPATAWPALANLGLLNQLGATGVANGGVTNPLTDAFAAGAPSSAVLSSSSLTHADGTPSSPVASPHNALTTTSKSARSSSMSTAVVPTSAAAGMSSDLGSPPPSDPSVSSTSLVAPKPLSAPSSALAAVSAQVKAAAAADGLSGPVVKPGALPNGTSQASLTLTKNLSQFLLKLYNMVDDPTTDDLIHWSEAGTSFVVENAEDLAKSVLPKFFKHSNFSSFVRQLNMYSFRKVTHITQGSLAGSTDDHRWEFSNDHFVRGSPDQLCFITRKKASGHDGAGDGAGTSGDLSNVLVEVTNVRKHQLTLSSEQKELQAHVQLLWRDMLSTKDQVARQQVTIDKILRFLASLYSAKDAKGGTASVAGNKLATGVGVDVADAGGSSSSGRGHDPEQSNIRKRKLQLLEYNPSSSTSGSGSRPGSPASSSPLLMDLDGFPDGVGVADIEQLPDSPTSPSPRGSPLTGLHVEEVQEDVDRHLVAPDDGMDVDGSLASSSKVNKGKAKAKQTQAPTTAHPPARRSSSKSSTSTTGGRRSGVAAASKATSAAKALEGVMTGSTVLSPPPTKAARKSNRTPGTAPAGTSKASAGRSSHASPFASSSGNAVPSAVGSRSSGAHSTTPIPLIDPETATGSQSFSSLLSMDHPPRPPMAAAPASSSTDQTLPTPEERLLWLTNEASRLDSQVQSLNPTIDDLTETAATGLGDLDLDVLLGSLPDISTALSTAADVATIPPAIPLDTASSPPSAMTPTPIPNGAAATQAAAGLPHLSPEAIMNLMHNPNALTMLAAMQGSEWPQLGTQNKASSQPLSSTAPPSGTNAATAPSPNLGDLSAFLSFESDHDVDADAAMGD